jgi:hypothetical protein
MSDETVLEVGQVWRDEDGDRVEIIAIDGGPYPVQFKWKDGTVGRAPFNDFLRNCSQPTKEWLRRLAASQEEAKHWCDAATRLTEDCMQSDGERAIAVREATRLREELESLRALLPNTTAVHDLASRYREALEAAKVRLSNTMAWGGIIGDAIAIVDAALAPPPPAPPKCGVDYCGRDAVPGTSWCGHHADSHAAAVASPPAPVVPTCPKCDEYCHGTGQMRPYPECGEWVPCPCRCHPQPGQAVAAPVVRPEPGKGEP